jgi:arylsulfatase A-like enzyme
MIVILDYSKGFYFGDKGSLKAGEHGNICAADSMIPFVVAGPGIPEKTVPFASLVDAVPTAAAILGFDVPTAEGKSIL